MDLLERVAENNGVLLRIERLSLPGVPGAARAAGFILTFDLGRILMSAGPGGRGLVFLHLEVGENPPGERAIADEDEPWWRVLGSPLVKATDDLERGVLALQFRKDDDNPRVVTVKPDGELVLVGLDPIA